MDSTQIKEHFLKNINTGFHVFPNQWTLIFCTAWAMAKSDCQGDRIENNQETDFCAGL